MGLSIARVHREIPGHLRSFLGNVPHGAGRFVLSAPSAARLRNHRGRSGVLILAVMTRSTLAAERVGDTNRKRPLCLKGKNGGRDGDRPVPCHVSAIPAYAAEIL
jgi:hypothetical protein